MPLLTSVPQRRIHELEQALMTEVTRRVQKSQSIEASDPEEIVVRDVLPQHDFESGGDNNVTVDGTGPEEWRIDWGSASATADSWAEAWEIDSRNQADEKVIGFIAVQFAAGDPNERALRFLKGTGGTQGVKDWFNLEKMENDEEGTGVFADAVIYGPTEQGSIEFWIEDSIDNQRTRLMGVTGEAVGETLSEPKNPLLDRNRQNRSPAAMQQ